MHLLIICSFQWIISCYYFYISSLLSNETNVFLCLLKKLLLPSLLYNWTPLCVCLFTTIKQWTFRLKLCADVRVRVLCNPDLCLSGSVLTQGTRYGSLFPLLIKWFHSFTFIDYSCSFISLIFSLWPPFSHFKRNNDSRRFTSQPPGDSTYTVTTSCLCLNLRTQIMTP